MSATLSGWAEDVTDPPGAAVVAGAAVVEVDFDALLLHAEANRAAPTASGTSHRALDMTDRMGSLLVRETGCFM
jgi:hypothetical protein